MTGRASTSPPIEILPNGEFAQRAGTVLGELRSATAALLSSFGHIDRAVDVSARLEVDRSLAWKVWQVAQGPGSFPAAAHIPGQQAVTSFLAAARKAGADANAVERVRSAFNAFEVFIESVAGDRATADSMLGALSSEGRSRHELAVRRDGYRATSHFLGLSAASVYQADIVLPSPNGHMPDVVRIRGHFGLRWLRPNVSWIVSRSTLVFPDGPSAELRREPLDPSAQDASSPPLLRRFCSDPVPIVRRRTISGVTVEDELVRDIVGQHGAVDVVTGERISQIPKRALDEDAVTMSLMTPCERLCYDVIVHESVISSPPVLRMYSTVQTEMPYVRGEGFNQIPIFEELVPMGPVNAKTWIPTIEVPKHRELISWTADLLGSRLSGCNLWRIRMRFPPIPACLAAAYALSR